MVVPKKRKLSIQSRNRIDENIHIKIKFLMKFFFLLFLFEILRNVHLTRNSGRNEILCEMTKIFLISKKHLVKGIH